jgi:hypothetical protein
MTETGKPREWITVREAAVLVGRHASRIYVWIDQGRLATRVNTDGYTEVLSRAVVRIESEVKRGRPRGSASGPASNRPR